MLPPRIGLADRCLGRSTLTWCAAIILATSLMTACDSRKWVDLPVPLPRDVFEKMKKNDPSTVVSLEDLARPVCSNLGKHFTGESRYEKGGVQVKCE